MKRHLPAILATLIVVSILGLMFVVWNNEPVSAASSAESARPRAGQLDVPPGVEQVEIFLEFDENVLQDQVNAWLRQSHGAVEIVRVLQTQTGEGWLQSITISIFYKNTE